MNRRTVVLGAIGAALLLAAGAGGMYLLLRDRGEAAAVRQVDALRPGLEAVAERDRARIAQRRQLWYVDDYATIKARAEAGEPLAQRRLAELYGDCLAMRGVFATNLSLLPDMGRAEPASKPRIDKVLAERRRLCTPAEQANDARPETYAFWNDQAAKRGDLVAIMRQVAAQPGDLAPQDLLSIVDVVARQGDAADVYEVSRLLPRLKANQWPDPETAPAFEGPLASDAWVLAACRAGLECAKGSKLLELACISMFSCRHPDYRSLLQHERSLDAATMARLDAAVALIDRKVLARPPAASAPAPAAPVSAPAPAAPAPAPSTPSTPSTPSPATG